MPRNLDTSLLRTFVTVSRRSTMTAAAHALHLTQGAISQQIKRLEECFGQRLFDRSQGRLKLTAAGERLLERAEQLVRLNDRILDDMSEPVFAGVLRVGAPSDLVGTYLAGIFKAFAHHYPHVEIVLVNLASVELSAALLDGRVDIAVIEQPASEPGGECLRIEPLAWVGAVGGNAHLKRPLAVSIVSDACVFRPALFDALTQHEIAWRTVFENGDIEATKATVRMDMAVTAWLASTVPSDLQTLRPAQGLPTLPDFAVTLHLPPSGTTPLVEEMANFIRNGFLHAPSVGDGRLLSGAADRAA
ncbi:LysR family transcriptional regulator [Burkholderia ambifaria]|uniref:LysR family transcriptional regulator n=2 Tax=Burkholderia ambifaria TaxID=152480 RepID=UPI00158EF06C|nr:LysR family transcriptional regulator [Burkholderia ambifaria]